MLRSIFQIVYADFAAISVQIILVLVSIFSFFVPILAQKLLFDFLSSTRHFHEVFS